MRVIFFFSLDQAFCCQLQTVSSSPLRLLWSPPLSLEEPWLSLASLQQLSNGEKMVTQEISRSNGTAVNSAYQSVAFLPPVGKESDHDRPATWQVLYNKNDVNVCSCHSSTHLSCECFWRKLFHHLAKQHVYSPALHLTRFIHRLSLAAGLRTLINWWEDNQPTQDETQD